MIQKRLIGLLLGLLVLPNLVSAAEAARLRRIVPADAFFYVGADDLTALREQLEKTPMGRFWNDPAVQTFFEPLRGKIDEGWKELLEGTPIPQDWSRLLPGEALFFSPDLVDHGRWEEIPLCFAAKTGLPRDQYVTILNEYINKLPPDAEKRQYAFKGVTVRMIEYRESLEVPGETEGPEGAPRPQEINAPAYFQYAFDDDVILVSDGDEKVMRDMVNRLKSAPESDIEDQTAVKHAMALTTPKGRITGFISTKHLAAALVRKMSADLGPELKTNIEGLGLQDLDGMAISLHLGERQVEIGFAVGVPQQGRGIVSILRRFRASPYATLAWTPASALVYSSFCSDWKGMYTDLRAAVRQFSPFLDMTIGMAENEAKINIAEVLGTFAGEIGYFTMQEPGSTGEPPTTVMITVKDSQRLGESIDSILLSLGEQFNFDRAEFLGHTIRTARPILPDNFPPEMREQVEQSMPKWVLTDDVLAISESLTALKEFLQLKSGKRKENFGATEDFKAGRSLLPDKVDAIKVTRLDEVGELLLRQLLSAGETPGFKEMVSNIVSLSSPPPAETVQKYFGVAVSGTNLGPDALTSRGIFRSAGTAQK